MQTTTRRIQIISPTTPDVPDDPELTVLTDENFDAGGLADDIATTDNTSAAAVTGSGTLTLSDAFALTGSLSLKVDGTAQHYLTFGADYDSHTTHYAQMYWRHDRTPSADAWLVAVRDGTDAATACQIGIDTAGKLIIRSGDSGGTDDTAAVAFTVGSTYRFDVTLAGGQLDIHVYTGTTLNSTDVGDAWDSLTCAISATAFSNEQVGLLVTISGTGTATGNLQNATFESGSNGDPVTTGNTGGDAIGGSGSSTISTAQTQDGTRSLLISGSTYNSIRYDNASHANHYVTFKYRHGTTPGGNAYIYELRDGGGVTVAAQIGIDTTGHLRVRDSNTGTGGALDTSTAALSTGTWYRVDATFAGSGDITVRYYTGATLDSTSTGDAVETLTATLTATNFGNELVGLIANVSSGTLVGYIDSFRTDSVSLPIGTVAVGIGGHLERYKSDSAAMPAPLEGDVDPPPPPVVGKLVPTTGCYIGATTAAPGVQTSSSAAGMTTYMNVTNGVRPHWVHVFQSGTNWNGVPTSVERNLFRPSGQDPAIPSWTWKINGAQTWGQIANGASDAAIRSVARGLMQYGHPQFLSFYHEPENDAPHVNGTTGYSAADFVAMYRHAVQVMRNEGVTDEHVVFQWIMVGYSNLADTPNANEYDVMYPGDDVVDWICWEPYMWANRSGLDLTDGLINENVASTAGWTGFYNWATTPRTGFTGTKPLALTEYGYDFLTYTDAQVATEFDIVRNGIQAYPQLKCLQYWNATRSDLFLDAQISGHANATTAYRNLVNDAYFQQVIT